MKTIEDLNNKKSPVVVIDNELSKINREKVFAEKLKTANEMLDGVELPKMKS